ncbi:hypothetical protein E4L96_10550 [Massilia arenosa]|uniref:Pyrrolo-quinoline quinone n=1 Tax=Zemynaea arenosa TaxID=2561931 RepID=A0A4Y9SCR2_9BURK|nr:hypothetical protein [Massilia arenosa]TFW20277.1 hypothetical protein E4L96_10550 [Massilia arenosa]
MKVNEMRALLAVAAVVALASCGGGGGGSSPVVVDPPPPPPPPPVAVNGPAWTSYGSDAQHSSLGQIATQPLKRVVWQTQVDQAPTYTAQGYLLVHYGSPVITTKNTVIIPIKRSATKFGFDARDGSNGDLKYSVESDYVMPPHNWTPPYNVTLTAANRVYAAGAGGKVYYRDDADSATSTTQTAYFYDSAVYTANKAALDANVIIDTPITADSAGNIYFGFIANAGNPANLKSGIARIGADGKGSWAAATTLAADPAIVKVAMNSAPAVSKDGKTLYVVVNSGSNGFGYLVALDAATLAAKSRVKLMDPYDKAPARVTDDSTASPTVGPDGEVYIGVLEYTPAQHNQRGWLLHYSADLAQTLIPGSFGWDDTPSIVPASMVPSYTGSSSYLITTKYNNYGRSGSGDSKNKVAVLDPHAAQGDSIAQTASVQVMKEILTILGPTPDPNYPGGVTEWCVNVAAVDPATKSILVNSEDGHLYRWDLATNTLSENVKFNNGLGESYTPTAIGADGKVYAINNARLYAVGQ